MGILSSCQPRKEVLKGDLGDAIFAADFGQLIANNAPKVYGDAATFFENTHPAQQLCRVVQAVFGRLADPKEGGATMRLSTGFGGGKTHTLMALWHLAQHIGDPGMGTEILPAAGRPDSVTLAASDAGKAGSDVFARRGKTPVRSLWGEMAYQLGKREAWKSLGDTDSPERQPDEALLESLLPEGPVLILLDELVIYMATLSDRGQGNLLAFLTKLAAVVERRPQTVLVVTDPAGQVAWGQQAAQIGDALPTAAQKLDEVFSRKMTDFDPIGDEAAKVIARRLFEDVDQAAAQSASALYNNLYQRVENDYPGTIPPEATSADFAKRIVECYPFHPRLVDTAQDRLGAMQDFQRSRGVLRLFARVIRDVWEAEVDHELITAGDMDWTSSRIQGDLLQRLDRDNFKAAVSADVVKHAGELDGENKHGLHRRVASALLLESLPLELSSGLDPAQLALAIMRPEEAGPEIGEALDRLVNVCWHTYPLPSGRGWQFRYEPNVIKQIEERMADIPVADAQDRVHTEAQAYFKGPSFKLAAWPSDASQVSDVADLQLAVCESEAVAQEVCAYASYDSSGAALPRRFCNSIVAVAPTPSALNSAVEKAQRLLAAEAIQRDYRDDDTGKLLAAQLKRVLPELRKAFRIQTCRAFDRVVLAGGASYALEEKYQVSDEQMLSTPHGQGCLKRFLEGKDLMYESGDALDVDRFLKDILPGATPLTDMPEAYTAKAVHERFLAAPGLRLIPDAGIVRQTLIKALEAGKIVIRLEDGRAFDDSGCVEGPEGKRRRITGQLTSFALDDLVFITSADSGHAHDWLKEDSPGDGLKPPPPPPPPGGPAKAKNWDDLLKYAANRPLRQLTLLADTPVAAGSLIALAQPLGAKRLSLNVLVSGETKDGGVISLAVNGLKPTHPAKPLNIAQTIFNALKEGAEYEAGLELDFGEEGRTGLEQQLQNLAEQAPEEVRPDATFDEPVGGAQ